MMQERNVSREEVMRILKEGAVTGSWDSDHAEERFVFIETDAVVMDWTCRVVLTVIDDYQMSQYSHRLRRTGRDEYGRPSARARLCNPGR